MGRVVLNIRLSRVQRLFVGAVIVVVAAAVAIGRGGSSGPIGGGGVPVPVGPWKTNVVPGAVSSMLVGLNGGWGSESAADMKGVFTLDRLDTSTVGGTEYPHTYNSAGISVIMAVPGTCPSCHYSPRGVSAINPTSWASQAVSWYETYCSSSSVDCPAVEVLNEPDITLFWGASAGSQANADAYAMLLKQTWEAFHARFGSAAPKILGAYEGVSWGGEWWHNTLGLSMAKYVDGVVVHPYGGCATAGNGASGDRSSQGDRSQVFTAFNNTGKPVWITEVGWPTNPGAGCSDDSEQWTPTQQAANIYDFVTWARSTKRVAAITYYNYRDPPQGGQRLYGVVENDGTKKPGWTALSEAAKQEPCTVCSGAS